jgi:hypothetical protein
MSKAAFTITSDPTTRELVRRVIAANDGIERDRRAMLKGQGRRFVSFAQDEAPKRTGVFASKIFYRTFSRGDVEELNVFTPQPLGKWITEGTRPHVIRAKRARFLRFYWPKVGRVVYFKSVNHPGTKANPFMSRAYRRWLPGARADLRLIAQNWSRTIQGAAVSPKDLSA